MCGLYAGKRSQRVTRNHAEQEYDIELVGREVKNYLSDSRPNGDCWPGPRAQDQQRCQSNTRGGPYGRDRDALVEKDKGANDACDGVEAGEPGMR